MIDNLGICVENVNKIKFLDVCISKNLCWISNIIAVVMNAHQLLYLKFSEKIMYKTSG